MIIVEGYFPFLEVENYKKRPLVALTKPLGKYNLVICAFITSKIPSKLLETDLVLNSDDQDFATTGLLYKSVIRLHKLATLSADTNILGKIGDIREAYQQALQNKLKYLFDL